MISSFESGRFDSHFLKPFVEKRDLRAFRGQFRKVRPLKKLHDRVAPALDFRYGVGKFSLSKKDGGFGPRIHHQHVRPELLQAPGKILAIGVFVDESEKIEIALRVPHDPFEIVDLKQTQIAVIILDSLLLQLGALFRREFVGVACLLQPGSRAAGDIPGATRNRADARPSGRPVISICKTPRSMRSCSFSRPSGPVILRTLIVPLSWGQSSVIVLRSKLIVEETSNI